MLKLQFCVLLAIIMVSGREINYIKPAESEVPKLLEVSVSCIAEANIDADTIEKFLTWTFKDTENVRKYIFCFMHKAKYADNAGHLIVKNIIPLVGDHMKKDQFQRVLEECNKLEGKDAHETVYKICGCAHDKSPILFTL